MPMVEYSKGTIRDFCQWVFNGIFQYVGWYDDDSLGGLEKSVEKMIGNDPNFGTYHNINSRVTDVGVTTM